MKNVVPIPARFAPLAEAIFQGDIDGCLCQTDKLLQQGVTPEEIVMHGMEKAMEALDEKCAVNQLNLLEIMLAGRGVNAILGKLYPAGDCCGDGHRGTVVLAALEGDVHDLGKNLVRTVLRARGFRVVDLGNNVVGETVVDACAKEGAIAVGISGLLTSVVPQVKKMRSSLQAAGLDKVLVLAGGAALKQGTPETLNVDYVAESVFDGANYLEHHHRPEPAQKSIPVFQAGEPTALERINQTLRFEKTDRPPVIATLFGHTARHCGLSLRDYRANGTTLAECQLATRKAYGHDVVFAIMDLAVEAGALGAELDDPPDAYPAVISPLLSSAREVSRLALPNPERDGRMPEILRACRALRRSVHNDFPVVGGVVGPVTLAAELLGLEAFLFALHDDPEPVERLLDFCTATVMAYGLAQLRAGAHLLITLDPTTSPAVLPPHLFRQFGLPYLRRIFHEFSKNKSMANWLLTTGPVLPILPDLPATGADLVNFDYCVPAAAARSTLPQMPLNGNIAPLNFVSGNPSQISHEVQMLVEVMQPRGGWILSAGCEIPPEAHPENIASMVQALHATR